jgi:hypothetical protein
MTNMNARPTGSGIAHKAAAVALMIVSIVAAFVAYLVFGPDRSTMRACINAGGSGGGCPMGGLAIPFFIVIGGFLGAVKVWRRS